jgi:hypothetical protein
MLFALLFSVLVVLGFTAYLCWLVYRWLKERNPAGTDER